MGILFVTMIWKDQSCIFGSWCISFIWNLNFSLGLSYTERWTLLSPVWLFATPWTVQYMEFSSLEYWSGKPFPSPGDLLNPGIKPRSPTLQADSLPAEPQRSPGILEWLAYPFFSRSSQPRNRPGLSCIAGRFFTNWAIQEAWGTQRGIVLRARGEEGGRGWEGWMASSTQWTWVWENSESEGEGSLACCSPWSCKKSDTTQWLYNNKCTSYMRSS